MPPPTAIRFYHSLRAVRENHQYLVSEIFPRHSRLRIEF